MPRLPRFVLVGQPQHVIVRGNNREDIFRAEGDYQFYLDKLKLACEKHECDLHAFVLMTNHVHLLITPHISDGISKAMQMIGRHYVQYFNYSYKRTGTLWEGRYKATLIDSEQYALTCYRYIELNPVRANMMDHPANALEKHSDMIVQHPLYKSLGKTQSERCQSYRALFKAHIPDRTIKNIRSATNKSWVLGDDDFVKRIAGQVNRPMKPQTKGGDRKSEVYRNQSSLTP